VALFRQVYEPVKGELRGVYADNTCAAVENKHGKGRALLLGSFPSVAYFRTDGAANGAYFDEIVEWFGIQPRVTSSNPAVVARLHTDGENTCLWALNMSDEEQKVSIRIAAQDANRLDHVHWGDFKGTMNDNALEATLPPQDALIVRLSRFSS
jgi:beta-galactosidase